MPCSDITEVCQLQLDGADRLVRYELRKRTCGAEIGRADLLQGLLVGRHLADILTLTGDDIRAHVGAIPDAEEFLFMKHLVATQAAIEVYSGSARGRPGDPCVVEAVEASPDGVTVTTLVVVNALTEKIRACGNCGSCGSAKKARGSLAGGRLSGL